MTSQHRLSAASLAPVTSLRKRANDLVRKITQVTPGIIGLNRQIPSPVAQPPHSISASTHVAATGDRLGTAIDTGYGIDVNPLSDGIGTRIDAIGNPVSRQII